MKKFSFLVAAVLLSTNLFAQAKPSDLSPTPLTHTADSSVKTGQSPAAAVKGKGHRAAGKVKKVTRKHASNAKNHMHVAKAKIDRNNRKNAVR